MQPAARRPAGWAGLFIVLGAATAWPGCFSEAVPEAKIKPAESPLRLVVVTPHNERIRTKFERGFAKWHAAEYGKAVDIHWITRGTPQCLTFIRDTISGKGGGRRAWIPDLMFGGGLTEHQGLVDHGLARELQGSSLQSEGAVPESLLGVPLGDERGYWHATALTSFGILFHSQACQLRGIPEPGTWADLADPAYLGWVTMADPTRSGSNRFCLNLVLQRHGWDQGWGLILRMAANSRALLPTSNEVLATVSSGLCLAGLSVNFNALHEVARTGGERLAFIAPPDATAITPDVTTVLKFAASPELAEQFVRFCLSEQGQLLWSLRETEQADADEVPRGDTLYRYPVVPAIYAKYGDRLSVAGNPFERKSGFQVDMALEQKEARIIAPLLMAACGDNHVLLQTTWQAVIDAGMPAEPLALLTTPLFDEATAYDLGVKHEEGGAAAERLTAEWSAAFRAKYEAVLAALKG